MPRPLIMWNLITLEGFFEGPKKWDLDWHEYVWGGELEKFSAEQGRSAAGLVFGRVTYEGMASYWTKAKGATADFMNSVPKYVFSRSLAKADWNNSQLVRGNAVEEMRKLKSGSGGNLFVFGSADLSSTFIDNDLFDEYRLCLVPVVLGAGTPLFKHANHQTRMTLRESRTLETGGVILYLNPREAAT